MQCDFKGKVVAITGASGNSMGVTIARSFYEDGAYVSICSRSYEHVKESALNIAGDDSEKIHFMQADMSNVKDCYSFIDETVNKFGKIDVLINNAAVQFQESALDTTQESWDITYNTKARGYFFCAQAAAKDMIKRQQNGCIINIGSGHSQVEMPNRLSYSTANASVDQMTRYTAREWGPYGIRVNCILPGSFPTGINTRYQDNTKLTDELSEKLPLRRRGKLEEMSYICEFLASDLAGYITGAVIPVDGGYILCM